MPLPMHHLTIYTVGKLKERWLESALSEYTKRLQPDARISWKLAKDDHQLERFAAGEERLVCLDPCGKLMTSEAFSSWLSCALVEGGARLAFVIGGAEGLPPSLKQRATKLISLSPLTFTHQIVRLLLLEQVYRAFEISKGGRYHK